MIVIIRDANAAALAVDRATGRIAGKREAMDANRQGCSDDNEVDVRPRSVRPIQLVSRLMPDAKR